MGKFSFLEYNSIGNRKTIPYTVLSDDRVTIDSILNLSNEDWLMDYKLIYGSKIKSLFYKFDNSINPFINNPNPELIDNIDIDIKSHILYSNKILNRCNMFITNTDFPNDKIQYFRSAKELMYILNYKIEPGIYIKVSHKFSKGINDFEEELNVEYHGRLTKYSHNRYYDLKKGVVGISSTKVNPMNYVDLRHLMNILTSAASRANKLTTTPTTVKKLKK